MSEKFKNFATSTLAANVLAGDTTLTVQTGDGSKFPDISGSDIFRVLLFNEVTHDYEFAVVTEISGDVLTCQPIQHDYNAGDPCENRPSEEFFNGLDVSKTEIQQGNFVTGDDVGATDAYVVNMDPPVLTLRTGQEIRVRIGQGNSNSGGACTVKLNDLAPITVSMEEGSNPPANSIKAGFVHTFVFDGNELVFQSQGLALTSSGFHALNKQIKNVAAGTDDSDVATIGLTETLKRKTIADGRYQGTQQGFVGDVEGDLSGTADKANSFSSDRSISIQIGTSEFEASESDDGNHEITLPALSFSESIGQGGSPSSIVITDSTYTYLQKGIHTLKAFQTAGSTQATVGNGTVNLIGTKINIEVFNGSEWVDLGSNYRTEQSTSSFSTLTTTHIIKSIHSLNQYLAPSNGANIRFKSEIGTQGDNVIVSYYRIYR